MHGSDRSLESARHRWICSFIPILVTWQWMACRSSATLSAGSAVVDDDIATCRLFSNSMESRPLLAARVLQLVVWKLLGWLVAEAVEEMGKHKKHHKKRSSHGHSAPGQSSPRTRGLFGCALNRINKECSCSLRALKGFLPVFSPRLQLSQLQPSIHHTLRSYRFTWAPHHPSPLLLLYVSPLTWSPSNNNNNNNNSKKTGVRLSSSRSRNIRPTTITIITARATINTVEQKAVVVEATPTLSLNPQSWE